MTRKMIALALAMLLCACGNATSTPEPTPVARIPDTPTSTAVPTHTPTPPPTETLTPMPTAMPTEAPPTETLSPSPTPPPAIFGELAFDADSDGDREIYLMKLDGAGQDSRNLRKLTDNDVMDGLPDWSPDGGQMTFVSDRDGDLEIYVMDADGDNVRQLTDNEATDSLPDWSPDGTRITFVSDRDGNFEVYVMDVDGSHQRRMTDNPDKDWWPDWSPDGAQIAFTRFENWIRHLYVIDVLGAAEDVVPKPRLIVRDAGFAAWSPDGTQFAFSSERDNNVELYLMDVNGRNLRRLTTSRGLDFVPAWSPDGRWIAWSSEQPKAEIYVMAVPSGTDAEGGAPLRLTKSPAQDWSPVWRPASAPSPLPSATPTVQEINIAPTPATTSISDMVYVPPGEFLMGSNADSEEEKPAHTVYVDAFWIDRTEVTYGQYERFLNHLGGHEGQCAGYDCIETKDVDRNSHMLVRDGQYVVEDGYENYPMAEVNWYGAQAYCAWVGKRLPTEAEWEKAARGTDGRRYPWGNSEPDCSKVNYRTCVRHTIDVGAYPTGASPYGALDMAGNVYEWTSDWFGREYYQTPAASQPNPRGPESGVYKVARGGSSYDLDLFLIRTTYRFGNDPKSYHRLVGFRCASD